MKKSLRFARTLFLSAIIGSLFGASAKADPYYYFITNGSTSTGSAINYYGYISPIPATVPEPFVPTTVASGTATPSAANQDRLYVTGNATTPAFTATFDGATASVNCFGIGISVGQSGTLSLTNNSTINVSGGGNNMFWVGSKGTGTLNILSGSKVSVSNGLSVGMGGGDGSTAGTGVGTVLVSGAGSTLTVTGGNGLTLGGLVDSLSGSKGTLTVENGGTVNVNTNATLYVGKNAGSGELNINTGGTVTAPITHTGKGTTTINGGTLNVAVVGSSGYTQRIVFGANGGLLNVTSKMVQLSANNKYWGTGDGQIHLSINSGTTIDVTNGAHTGTQPVFYVDKLNGRFYDNNQTGADAPILYMNNTASGAYTGYLDSYAWVFGVVNAGTKEAPVTINANEGGYRFNALRVGEDGQSGYLVLTGAKGFWLSGGTGGLYIGDMDNAAGAGTVVLSEGSTLQRTDGAAYTSDRNIYVGTGQAQGRLILAGGTTDATWNKTYLGANGTIEINSPNVDYSVAARNLKQNDGHFEVTSGKLTVAGQTINVAAIASAGLITQRADTTTASILRLDNTTTPYVGTVGTMSEVQYIEVHAVGGTAENPVVIGADGQTTNYGVRVLAAGNTQGDGYLKLAGGTGTKVYIQGAQGTNGGLNIGNTSGMAGTLVVGENVTLTISGDTTPRIGSAGTGTVTVGAGAKVTNGQQLLIATGSSGTGNGTLNLSGSWASAGNVSMGGYGGTAGGKGTINIYDGGLMTAGGDGVYLYGNSSSINIYSGGELKSAVKFDSATAATMTIQGGTFTGSVHGQNQYTKDLAIKIIDGGTFNLTSGGARINSVTGTGDFIINNTAGLLNISGNDAIVGNAFTSGNIYNDSQAHSNSVLTFNSTTNVYKGVISGRQGNGEPGVGGAIDGVVNLGTESAPITFSATASTNYGQYGIVNNTGMVFRNFIVGGAMGDKNAVANAVEKYVDAGVNANAYALLDGGTYSVGLNSNGLIVGHGTTDQGVLKLQNGAKFTSDGATIRIGVYGTGELIITGGSQVGTTNQVALVGYRDGTGNGTISVDGAGSRFYVNELHLGGYQPDATARGVSGTVNITNGGTVAIAGNVFVGMDSATGTINIDGGTFTANNLTLAAGVGTINFSSLSAGTTPITVSGATTLNGSVTVDVSDYDFSSGAITLIDSGTMTKSATFAVQGAQNNAGGNHVDWAVSGGDLKIGQVLELFANANTYIARYNGYANDWNTASNWIDKTGAVKTVIPNAESLVIVGENASGASMGATASTNAAFSTMYVGYTINAAGTDLNLSKGALYLNGDNVITGKFYLGNGSLTSLGGQNTSINGTVIVEGATGLGANGDNRKLNIGANISSYSDSVPGTITISTAANLAGTETVGQDVGGAVILGGNNAGFLGEWILGAGTRRGTLTANSVDALGTDSTITMTNTIATNSGAAGTNRGQTLNVNATQNNVGTLALGKLSQVNLANNIEFHVGEITKVSADTEDDYSINWKGQDTKVYVQKIGSAQDNIAVKLNQAAGSLDLTAGNDSLLTGYNLGENAILNLIVSPDNYLGFTLTDTGTTNLLGTINVVSEDEWFTPSPGEKAYLFANIDALLTDLEDQTNCRTHGC